MDVSEDFFLEYSIDNGSNYMIYKSCFHNVDFINDLRENESVSVTGINFTNVTIIRFRCDVPGNRGKIFIDDVAMEA